MFQTRKYSSKEKGWCTMSKKCSHCPAEDGEAHYMSCALGGKGGVRFNVHSNKSEWERKHEAKTILDAYQDAHEQAREQGLSKDTAAKVANREAERARRRYSGKD